MCTLTASSGLVCTSAATARAVDADNPMSSYICASSASSPAGCRRISSRSTSTSLLTASFCVSTDVYSMRPVVEDTTVDVTLCDGSASNAAVSRLTEPRSCPA